MVGGIGMELKDYTTEELRAELKKRNAEERAKKASILKCKMCKHWGAINYWGNPNNYLNGRTQPCKFFKTKMESIIDVIEHQNLLVNILKERRTDNE